MKLEVGMYVRTNQGIIAKLIDKEIKEKGNVFIFDKTLYSVEYEYDNTEHIKELTDFESYMSHQGTIDIITKASFNLIDLIEEGDYVNGHCVDSIHNYNETELIRIEPYKIHTILTHEQYEANCYKVGE